jgi:hypothetical protein
MRARNHAWGRLPSVRACQTSTTSNEGEGTGSGLSGFRAAIQAQLSPSGLVPDSTKGIVEGVRARYLGRPLEMLIPINAEAVAKELAETGVH